jgi:hypothetical protein
MKKINSLLLVFALLGSLQLLGCKKKTEPKSALELIQKTWRAQEVKEDGTIAYTAPYDAANDTRDYSSFKLEFTSGTDVRLTESDGNAFNGKWTLNGSTLTLSQLAPEPTGGNTITYTNVSVTETELRITRAGNNPKTGKSNTQYTLQ